MLAALALSTIAITSGIAADTASLSMSKLKAATPRQQIDLVLAALPRSTNTLRRSDIAHPPIINIDADADGWFLRTKLYAVPTTVRGPALCERRVLLAQFRPDRLEYPMSSTSVISYPLRHYWTAELKGYRRVAGEPVRAQCPVERDASYTDAPDAATALRVFDALDGAIRAIEGGRVPFTLECDARNQPQPCTDGLSRLRSLARQVSAIVPQSASARSDAAILYAQGIKWSALFTFDRTGLTKVQISLTPPPPIA